MLALCAILGDCLIDSRLLSTMFEASKLVDCLVESLVETIGPGSCHFNKINIVSRVQRYV
jgi:hypothetical protein